MTFNKNVALQSNLNRGKALPCFMIPCVDTSLILKGKDVILAIGKSL